jgi:hypothetical protein
MTKLVTPVDTAPDLPGPIPSGERPDAAPESQTYKEVLVVGDSHASIFSDSTLRAAFPHYLFNVVCIGGATASGLENPNSKTQSLPRFIDAVQKSEAETIIVLLGEVDTGFVIWYRAEKYKTEVSEMLLNALASYQRFLMLLLNKHRVICLSAPLPTIKDGQEWGLVANARRGVRASQLDRTMLTIRFNKRVKKFCAKNRIEYLDFDSDSIGSDGLVDIKLLNRNPLDHHYEPRAYIEMIIPELRKHL